MTESILLLNIQRTASTKRYCCYPKCGTTSNLKVMSKFMRCYILKNHRVFCPDLCRVCTTHEKIVQWTNISVDVKSDLNKFAASQIEDMVNLLFIAEENRTVLDREY